MQTKYKLYTGIVNYYATGEPMITTIVISVADNEDAFKFVCKENGINDHLMIGIDIYEGIPKEDEFIKAYITDATIKQAEHFFANNLYNFEFVYHSQWNFS